MNVQVEQTENPGELYISWSPPLKDSHNGAIIGYHVKAMAQSIGSGKKFKLYVYTGMNK